MTRMAKATEKGLEDLSKHVLAPYFHQQDNLSKKVRGRIQIVLKAVNACVEFISGIII